MYHLQLAFLYHYNRLAHKFYLQVIFFRKVHNLNMYHQLITFAILYRCLVYIIASYLLLEYTRHKQDRYHLPEVILYRYNHQDRI